MVEYMESASPSLSPNDYTVTDDEAEDVCCPECDAGTGEPCQTGSGDFALATHARRVKKAQGIARDLAVAGCLPEHDPERYSAAVRTTRKSKRASPR
jgi:hypothetical protein